MAPQADNDQHVMPYLIVTGAERFMAFAHQVFDARETLRVMRDAHAIRHAEVLIGASTIMLAESTRDYGDCPAGLFVYVDDADKRYALALAAGAKSLMPPANQTYGRSCGIKDPWGNTWWVTSV